MFFFNGLAAKCELCGGAPRCVEACEWGALNYAEPGEIGFGKRMSSANLARRNNKEQWVDWWADVGLTTIDMKKA
jgi:Fe-S-cluster-containing hydrogenase component 2